MSKERDDFITIYFEDGDMKIEFAFSDVHLLSVLLNTVTNGENREAILYIVDNKLRNAGLTKELAILSSSIDTSIRPSEVYKNG